MRELRPLRLPQLLEARKNDDTNMSPRSQYTPATSSTDLPSPVTPTFSLRGHTRLPSSTSSLTSSPVMSEAMDGFGSGKRPLTEVREEPQEREDDYEMVDSPNCPDDEYDLSSSISYTESSTAAEAHMFSSSPEYDLADSAQGDLDFSMAPSSKRQCAGEPASTGLSSRIGTRFPSLSQKWKNKRGGKTASIVEGLQDFRPARSRANSTRAPSLAGSEVPDKDYQLPPTPTKSVYGEKEDDAPSTPIDLQKADAHEDEPEEEMKASTPLLPPIMANISTHLKEVPFQSPLQSPTVADPDSSSVAHTPITSPQMPCLPSPPLSTKPSVSSFHRHPLHSPLIPASEIPPLPLAPTNDPWTDKLGHANFTITPEPYLPSDSSLIAYKQLRADWETARCNYTKHLMRTGENYGATSKIYRLTEEKWAEIASTWKRNLEICIAQAQTADQSQENAMELSQSSAAEPAPLIKLPSLNGPRSEGKFPKLGDDVIVGPMEQVAAQMQTKRTSKKRTFLKFLQGMLPSGSGMFGRERSPG